MITGGSNLLMFVATSALINNNYYDKELIIRNKKQWKEIRWNTMSIYIVIRE